MRFAKPHIALLFALATTFVVVRAEEPPLVAPTEALTPEQQRAKFHLPPGFKIELIAAEPAIRKPMNMAFDAKGRLFVTQSVEYPFPARGGKPRDTVQVFEDTNGDGIPDTPHTFADGLNIPIGICPLPEGALVYSIPQIWTMGGVDAKGLATKRAPAYGQFGFRDTHGMASSFTRWIDGWIYACHGFSNTSDVRAKDGSMAKMNSGNTYRIRRDGAHIEQWTHGQVNPFGLCFDSWGDLYSADCHTKPAYLLLRGAYYPSFGKPHDGLGYGPELLQHLHGSTGIAGIVSYEAQSWPAEYRQNLFIGNPVTGRINRDRLETRGSTRVAVEMPDFLWCDDLWFRPVDLKLAPDGSLYVADFYNCIIGHYEVPLLHPRRDREKGRIWRISYVGNSGANKSPGDLTKAPVDRLVSLLGDANITTRVLATNQLIDFGGSAAVDACSSVVANAKSAPDAVVHAMWVVERGRKTGLDDGQLQATAARSSAMVRTHLVKLLAERIVWTSTAKEVVEAAAEDENPLVRRAAADALGRHPSPTSGQLLLRIIASAAKDDALLQHTARIALRDNLVALHGVYPTAFGDRDLMRLADVSLGAGIPQAAAFLQARLAAGRDDGRLYEYLSHAARYADSETFPRVVAWALSTEKSDYGRRIEVVRSFADGLQRRGMARPDSIRSLEARLAAALLAESDAGLAQRGLELIRDLHVAGVWEQTVAAAKRSAKHFGLRPIAFEAIAAVDARKAIDVLGEVLVVADEPIEFRWKAAELLGAASADPAARKYLVEALPLAPRELALRIGRGLVRHIDGARSLAKLIADGKLGRTILLDADLRNSIAERRTPDLDRQVAAWVKDLPSENEQLAALMGKRREEFFAAAPDAKKGEASFTKNCAICHQVAGKGAKIGPQLDGVGVRGLDRLLEDTLAPNRNVDQAFRATRLALKDGRSLSGLVLREEGEVVVLADANGKEQRISKSEIEQRQQSLLSPMPNDVASRLPAAEFRDLLGYLLSQRQTQKGK